MSQILEEILLKNPMMATVKLARYKFVSKMLDKNDKIIDTSGNKNIGIMIGDYSISKKSTLVPLTREMNMKLPETDTEDKAI